MCPNIRCDSVKNFVWKLNRPIFTCRLVLVRRQKLVCFFSKWSATLPCKMLCHFTGSSKTNDRTVNEHERSQNYFTFKGTNEHHIHVLLTWYNLQKLNVKQERFIYQPFSLKTMLCWLFKKIDRHNLCIHDKKKRREITENVVGFGPNLL